MLRQEYGVVAGSWWWTPAWREEDMAVDFFSVILNFVFSSIKLNPKQLLHKGCLQLCTLWDLLNNKKYTHVKRKLQSNLY